MATDEKSGVLFLAKQSGETSFSSLNQIKRALGTKKIGHTGTLDSFADGLLIATVGKMTKFAGEITNCDKEYEAILELGVQTETLDPVGKIIARAEIPSKEIFVSALNSFCGEIWQVPPNFSAIHINGKRASDLARAGVDCEIQPRKVKIFSIELRDFVKNYAHLKVLCSKGTYIRSLARDIAKKCNSVAHLAALRRTKIGDFSLSDACGEEFLPHFSIDNLPNLQNHQIQKIDAEKIKNHLKNFSPTFAESCGLKPIFLKKNFLADFSHGKPIQCFWFENFAPNSDFCVFCEDAPCGKIRLVHSQFAYQFVCI